MKCIYTHVHVRNSHSYVIWTRNVKDTIQSSVCDNGCGKDMNTLVRACILLFLNWFVFPLIPFLTQKALLMSKHNWLVLFIKLYLKHNWLVLFIELYLHPWMSCCGIKYFTRVYGGEVGDCHVYDIVTPHLWSFCGSYFAPPFPFLFPLAFTGILKQVHVLILFTCTEWTCGIGRDNALPFPLVGKNWTTSAGSSPTLARVGGGWGIPRISA